MRNKIILLCLTITTLGFGIFSAIECSKIRKSYDEQMEMLWEDFEYTYNELYDDWNEVSQEPKERITTMRKKESIITICSTGILMIALAFGVAFIALIKTDF